jgi:putative flavoprotein involved in K+ transport
MLRDEIVDYIKRYAASFNPPYRAGVEVQRITAAEDTNQFTLTTSDGVLTARNIVITVGTHQHPNFPEWDEDLPDGVTGMHTRDYRNAEGLADGAVFIVGSGQSGCQVAEDLHLSGRYMTMPVEQHPMGTAIRFKAHPHLSGRDGGRTIDLRRMALDGIQLHGKVLGIEEGCFRLSSDLAETLVGIDEVCRDEMAGIDKFIEENGLDDPMEEVSLVDWLPEPEPALLDLSDADVLTVIYATGFHFDFSWIDLPIFDERGYPRYARGVTEIPGLYYCGLHWMHTQGSGLFYGVGEDAKYVVAHLLNRIDS